MYENMTFETIHESLMKRVTDNVDKREGSIIWDAMAPAAYFMAEFYFKLNNYPDLILPDTTVESFLDRTVPAYNLKRKPAVKATRKVISGVVLETGSRWQIQDISFIIKSKSNDMEYIAECEQFGNIGNLYFGAMQPINNAVIGEVVLGEVLTTGADEETDEALRERMLNKIRRPSTSGNVHDYYNWAMSCAGVGAAKVFPLVEGPGTVKVVIVDADKSAADASLVDSVSQHIESLRPIGATVTVVSAREKAINVSARIILAAGITLGAAQNRFQQAITGYLQGSAFEAGYISLAKMGNLLLDVPGVEDYSELKLNGTAGNVSVADEEVAVTGAVRLEV